MPVPKPIKNVMKFWNHEWLKSGERFSRRYLRAVPDLGKAMSMNNLLLHNLVRIKAPRHSPEQARQ